MEKIIRFEPSYRSYAESYSLRGLTKVPLQMKFNSVLIINKIKIGIEVCVLDSILSIPELYEKNIFT